MQGHRCKISYHTLFRKNELALPGKQQRRDCIVNTILKYWNESCIFQDILMKYVKAYIHSADIAQGLREHWTYLCRKIIRGKEVILSYDQKCGLK